MKCVCVCVFLCVCAYFVCVCVCVCVCLYITRGVARLISVVFHNGDCLPALLASLGISHTRATNYHTLVLYYFFVEYNTYYAFTYIRMYVWLQYAMIMETTIGFPKIMWSDNSVGMGCSWIIAAR